MMTMILFRLRAFRARVLVLPLLALATGCNSGAEGVVKDYRSQEKCEDRLKFVLDPDANRARLLDHYKTMSSCASKTTSIDATNCKSTPEGADCTVNVDGESKDDKSVYCMKRTSAGFKIDWGCSVRYSSSSLAAIQSTHTTVPSLIRANVKLSQYYGGAFSNQEANFFSFSIGDGAKTAFAFAPRTSDRGSKLFELVKDGQPHSVTIGVAVASPDPSKDELVITHLISPDWRSTPAEFKPLQLEPPPAPPAPAASVESLKFSTDKLKGSLEACTALHKCCDDKTDAPGVDAYCYAAANGLGFPDCERSLAGVYKLWTTEGRRAPVGCAPMK